MIKVYTGATGLAFFLLFIVCILLFFKVLALLVPVWVFLNYALIVFFLLGILPGTFFKHLRPRLGILAVLTAQLMGVLTWMVIPFAFVRLVYKGSWVLTGDVAVWMAFAYIMKSYSHWLVSLDFRQEKKTDVIDVEGRVV